MTVDRLDVSVFTIPTEDPESDGTLTWTETTVVIAEPHASGCAGLGFTYGPGACATLIRDVLEPVVLVSDPFDVTGTWAAMVRAVRNVGRPGVASMAIAAVDVALWDLKAKLLDLPLSRLLGSVFDEVAVYGSGGFTSYTLDELARQLGRWVHDDGIPRVKMKVGSAWDSSPDRDLARAEAAREAIGPGAELFVDANGAYTRKQAVRLSHAFADLGVTWFEEPGRSSRSRERARRRRRRRATPCRRGRP